MKFRFDLVTTQKSFSSVSAAGRDLGQRGGERSKLKARPGASVPQKSSVAFRNFIAEETETL